MRILNASLLSIALLYTISTLHAQTKLDSLKQNWLNESLHDTIRIDALLDYMVEAWMVTNADSFEHYAHQHLFLSQKMKDAKRQATSYNAIAIAHYYKQDYENAISYYKKAQSLALGNNDLENYLALSTNIARAYASQGEYANAIMLGEESFKKILEQNYSFGLTSLYNTLSSYYLIIGDHETALRYGLEAFNRLAENDPDELMVIEQLSDLYMEVNDYENAKELLMRSITVADSIQDFTYLPSLYERIIKMYMDQDSLAMAEKYLGKTDRLADSVQSYYTLLYRETFWAAYYTHQQHIIKSNKHL